MISTQTAMGGLIAAVSIIGLLQVRWLLENARYGRRLVRWFGYDRGKRILCGILIAFVIFGVLLAADVIRPIHWNKL